MEDTIGSILCMCYSILCFVSYLPQIFKLLRTKSSEDLSVWGWVLYVLTNVFYLLYIVLVTPEVGILVMTGLDLFLCAVTLVLTIKYRKERN